MQNTQNPFAAWLAVFHILPVNLFVLSEAEFWSRWISSSEQKGIEGWKERRSRLVLLSSCLHPLSRLSPPMASLLQRDTALHQKQKKKKEQTPTLTRQLSTSCPSLPLLDVIRLPRTLKAPGASRALLHLHMYMRINRT